MSTIETLERRRPHPALAIRPAILLTVIYLGGLFLAWIALNVAMADSGADRIVTEPSVLGMAKLIGWLLVAYVLADGWRGRRQTGRVGALLTTILALLGLGGALWYLQLLGRLPVF